MLKRWVCNKKCGPCEMQTLIRIEDITLCPVDGDNDAEWEEV